MRVKEVNDNGRPTIIEIEVGIQQYTEYEDCRIVWETERLGYFYESIMVWNPETLTNKIYWVGMDHIKVKQILDILINLGVVP